MLKHDSLVFVRDRLWFWTYRLYHTYDCINIPNIPPPSEPSGEFWHSTIVMSLNLIDLIQSASVGVDLTIQEITARPLVPQESFLSQSYSATE